MSTPPAQDGVQELGEVALPLAGVRAQVEPGVGELRAGGGGHDGSPGSVRRAGPVCGRLRRTPVAACATAPACVPSSGRRWPGQTASAWARRFTSVPRFSLQRLRGRAGQGRVGGEEPLQHLFVGEAVVPQERQGAGEALDDLARRR